MTHDLEENKVYSIHQLPEMERPRERLRRYGPEAMATTELIAIILGSGMKGIPILQLAQSILAKFGSVQKIAEATLEELREIKGLGEAKALQLKAAFNLGLRAYRQAPLAKVRIEHPVHAYQYIREELERQPRELLAVILQDVRGCVICHQIVSMGSLSQAPVNPRDVFYPAIRHHAASLILAHNHPSGDPSPSVQDIELTKHLINAGKLMRIQINDHLIIGEQSYLSLRQHGVSFT